MKVLRCILGKSVLPRSNETQPVLYSPAPGSLQIGLSHSLTLNEFSEASVTPLKTDDVLMRSGHSELSGSG